MERPRPARTPSGYPRVRLPAREKALSSTLVQDRRRLGRKPSRSPGESSPTVARRRRARGHAVDTRSATPWTEAGQDPEKLRLAQRGDLTAALEIFGAHKLPLWRTCLLVTRDAREAARLYEDTIARATRELPGAPAQQSLLPWLARLARGIDADRAESDKLDLSGAGEHRPDG